MAEPWAAYRDKPSWPGRLAALAVVVVVIAAAYWLVAFRGGGDRSQLALQVDQIVESAMEDGPITGVSVVVARGARIVHAAGYGYADVENEISAGPETVYHLGSITKQFTAAAIMEQVEEGRVDLEEPASRYLAEVLPEAASRFDDVTVAQLLSHTAGVRDYTINPSWWETLGLEVTPRRLANFFVDEPRDFEPGSRFAYSNSGYALLGLVVEAVTGRPFGGVLNESFFVPLSLNATAYCDDRQLIPNRAAGYQYDDDELQHAPYVSMSQAYAAGGVCSSARDLVLWSRALSRGQAVDRDSYELMRTPSTLNDGTRIEYGFGFSVGYLEGRHRIGHIGGMLGFSGQLAHYDEDDVTIVVLTNTEGASAAEIETGIARVVLGLGEQEVRDIALSTAELEQYVGSYDLGPTVIDVGASEGRLEADVTVPGLEGRYTMLYQGDDVFQAEVDSEISVTFSTDASGSATGFSLYHKGITMHGNRVSGPSSRSP